MKTKTENCSSQKENPHRQISPLHSHHGMQAKANSVRTPMKRAHDLMLDRDLLKDELHHVQGVLRCNGYPKGIVRKYKVQSKQEKG